MGKRADLRVVTDALGKLLLPSSDTPGVEQLDARTARRMLHGPELLIGHRVPAISYLTHRRSECAAATNAIRKVTLAPEELAAIVPSRSVSTGFLATAGVTSVGLIRLSKGDDARVGLGVEDEARPDAVALIDALRQELGEDLEVKETGRVISHTGPPFGSVRPIRPGCSVSTLKSTWGTVGAIIKTAEAGMAILSNAHVLDHRRTDAVVQPGRGEPGASPTRIGTRRATILPSRDTINICDAAVATLDDGLPWDPNVLVVDQPFRSPTNGVTTGTRVAKVGAASGLTYATVAREFTRVAVWYGNSQLIFRTSTNLLV